MVSGGSLQRMVSGITDQIAPELRRHIIISHCSGAEVWGFDSQGVSTSNFLQHSVYSFCA